MKRYFQELFLHGLSENKQNHKYSRQIQLIFFGTQVETKLTAVRALLTFDYCCNAQWQRIIKILTESCWSHLGSSVFPFFTVGNSIQNFTKISEEAEKLSMQFSSHPLLHKLLLSPLLWTPVSSLIILSYTQHTKQTFSKPSSWYYCCSLATKKIDLCNII